MTTTKLDDAALGSALAALWQRHRQSNLDLIALLEQAAADVLRGNAGVSAIEAAAGAAHKLAGSLGTFGFDTGSGAALEAELLLREPAVDGRLLAEAVTALRTDVEDASHGPEVMAAQRSLDAEPAGAESSILLVSTDTNLVSRLTVEAAAAGLVVSTIAALPEYGGGLEAARLIRAQSSSTMIRTNQARNWARSCLGSPGPPWSSC